MHLKFLLINLSIIILFMCILDQTHANAKKINSWLITQIDKGTQTDYLELDSSEFLSNEIIIEVKNSALNYKDALAITGMALL